MTKTEELLKELAEQSTIPLDLSQFLERNEQGDAELFAKLFEDKVLFDHSDKQWYLWNGRQWVPDKTGQVHLMVTNQTAAEYIDGAKSERLNGNHDLSQQYSQRARLLGSRRRIDNVLSLASFLSGLALDGSEWDLPPMILPVSNGLIDLETGEFREMRPSDYVRHYAPVEWHGLDFPAPIWEEAVLKIFNDDTALASFMQRLFGYAITGNTREQVLPIFWGEGANGKSTIKDVLSNVLGNDICSETQTDSLMDVGKGDGNAPRPFLYALRGKRLVWANEAKEGQRLNTGLVKQLTGDHFITARTLHSKPVRFSQTYKIILITNECPRLSSGGDDPAMWRRVLRIPFNTRFVDQPQRPSEWKRDKDLDAKLRPEYPGILAWLVRGCLQWQEQGLNPPVSVIESTNKYREDEDLIGQFVADCLLVGDGREVASAALHKEYIRWCESNGYKPISSAGFSRRMTRKFGQTTVKNVAGNPQRVYRNVGLLSN